MPEFLASVNITAATNLLRDMFLYDDKSNQNLKDTYTGLGKEFLLRIQRYESFILKIASAYAGYEFYLPAFVDFRGRIDRAGVLHFHERDLARSFIVFASRTVDKAIELNKDEVDDLRSHRMVRAAVSFHYQKFSTYEAATRWYFDSIKDRIENLIEIAAGASEPYQFISKVICLEFPNGESSQQRLVATTKQFHLRSYFALSG